MVKRKEYVGDFRKLKVYRKLLLFRKEVYSIVKTFPKFEEEIVCEELRKKSVSVIANVSEGNANFFYGKEFDRINTAIMGISGSRSLFDISYSENYISKEVYQKLDGQAEEMIRMLIAMVNRIKHLIEETENFTSDSVMEGIAITIVKSGVLEEASLFKDGADTIIRKLPSYEKNILIDQFDRASSSVLENLYDLEKLSNNQVFNSANFSLGSIAECQSFLDIMVMEKFLSKEKYLELDSVAKSIYCKLTKLLQKALTTLEKVA